MVERRGRLRGINRVRKRLADGSTVELHYIRGQRGAPAFWRSGDDCTPGDAEYERRYHAAKREDRAPAHNRFAAIVAAYRNSAEFRALAPRTRRDYGLWLDRIVEKFGSAPVAAFERPQIRTVALAWRDRWSGKQAQYAWTVLRRVVSWAYDAGHLTQHHLRGGGSVYQADRSEIIWLPEHQERFNAVAPEWARRILGTALETGLRPGDLIRLTWQHVENNTIRLKTAKKGRMAEIPITPAMRAILDATPRDRMLILVSERGRPLTTHRASEGVRQWRDKAKLPDHLRLYDCRGTAATRLLRAGANLSQIARCMGWSLRYAQGVIESYAVSAPGESEAVLDLLERQRRT